MRKLIALPLLLAGLSCREPKPPVAPENMAALLADAHLAEVRATQVSPDSGHAAGERNSDTLASWYGAVFAHHGLTQQQFLTAMDWYENHPTDLDSVYRRSVRILEKALSDTARK